MRTRQELLENLLQKEMEDLRKRCFKYKRRPFLENRVTIVEESLNEDDAKERAAGRYERINEVNDYKFEHKISIDSCVINDYLKCREKESVTKDNYKSAKKYYKRNLTNVIRHELVHAMVSEYFEPLSEIEGTYRDASPIFLSVLEFCCGVSHHKCAFDFENASEIYTDSLQLESFDQLEKYILKLMRKYEKVCSNLKQEKELREGFMKSISNNFEYSHRNAGLLGRSSYESRYICIDKRGKIDDRLNFFEIGCNITPIMVKSLVERKINSQSFEMLSTEKSFYKVATQVIITKDKNGKISKTKIEVPKSA